MTPVGDDGGHRHRHHDEVDWAAMAAFLSAWDDLGEPVHRAIAGWLGVGDGHVVVDVGSGAGGMTAVFADAVGAAGMVIAVDGDPCCSTLPTVEPNVRIAMS